jgi:hypothetical protein
MLSFYKRSLVLFTALLLIGAKTSLAQYGSYTPAMNAMFSQQFMMSMQNMQMRNMMAFNGMGEYNKKYDFTVNMKDGTTQEVSSKILIDTSTHKSYLLLVDKKLSKSDPNRNKKIYVDQTTSISRNTWFKNTVRPDDEKPSKLMTGIAKDTCWMFKVVSGPINAYSILSEEAGFTFSEYSLVGIQFNDGPIVKLNEENLTAMVGNDVDLIKKIKKKDFYKAIKNYNKQALKSK